MLHKAILFDVDGVLIKSDRFGDYYQKITGVTSAEMQPFFSGPFRECKIGKADIKKELVPWLEKWKWIGSPDEFLQTWFEYENKPNVELLNLIKKIRKQNVLCYLATNQEKYRAEFIWNTMKFSDYFDGMFCSSNLGVAKPDAKFYKIILGKLQEQHGISPEEILYFDNDPIGVEVAQQLGIVANVASSGMIDDLGRQLNV